MAASEHPAVHHYRRDQAGIAVRSAAAGALFPRGDLTATKTPGLRKSSSPAYDVTGADNESLHDGPRPSTSALLHERMLVILKLMPVNNARSRRLLS